MPLPRQSRNNRSSKSSWEDFCIRTVGEGDTGLAYTGDWVYAGRARGID